METTLPTTVEKAYPWRRNGNEQKISDSKFSAQAKEFVPSFNSQAAEFVPSFNSQAAEFIPSFNSQAAEFVPSFMMTGQMPSCAATPAQPAFSAICLDDYSDYSSDDEQVVPAASKPATVKQDPIVEKGDGNEPSQLSNESSAPPTAPEETESAVEKAWPWRKAQGEDATADKEDDEEERSHLWPTMSTITASTKADTDTPDSPSLSGTDASDQELLEEPDHSVVEEPDHSVTAFTVNGLLRLRHSVEWIEGIEDCLSAKEVSPRELPSDKATSDQKDKPPAENHRASKKPTEKTSWRDREVRERSQTCPGEAFASVRAEKTSSKLKTSDDSWVARQRLRRNTVDASEGAGQELMNDEQVVRAMKSILNKLTIEKFPELSRRLVTCGVRTVLHLETLIHEVFEKATTQHHFINMYADLCTVLHAHFTEHPVTDDPKMNFKKVLLNACQASFERHLAPPVGLDRLDEEDRRIAESMYKTRMLGNIRFVGALLVRKMLATKVMFAIIEELLSDPTAEALESLASLLSVVGPTFDVPEWPHHALLTVVFDRVQALTKQASVKARARCLLKDVLELRAATWRDRKPKRQEAPTTLEEVANKFHEEEAATSPAQGFNSVRHISSNSSSPGHWPGQGMGGQGSGKTCPIHSYGSRYNGGGANTATTGGLHSLKSGNSNITKLASELFVTGSSPKGSVPTSPQRGANSAAEQPKKRKDNAKEERFEKEACRKEVLGALKELRISYDVKEAILRVAAIAVPLSEQPEELCEVLAQVAEEGVEEVRKICFQFIAGLFTEGHWKPAALSNGLPNFITGICVDLKFDVPALPKIVHEELYTAFAPLVKNGLLQTTNHELLKQTF